MHQGRTKRAGTLGALVVALLGLLAAPAAAAPVEPPGWVDPGSGAWVAFTFGETTLSRPNRINEQWGPVTIQRSTSALLDLATAFPGPDAWATQAPTGTTEYGWPQSWSLGSIDLERVSWCPREDTSCDYYATGGTGQHLFFAAGTPELPDPTDLNDFDQATSLSLTSPVLNIVFGWDPSTARTPASGTTPGRLTLDASGSFDEATGNLTYAWTVTQQSTGAEFHQTGSIAQFDLDADDTYCVAVTVTNDDDPTHPATYGVDTPDCKPVDQLKPSGATPGPGSGGGTTGGGAAGGINVVFAPSRRASSALTGTAGGDSVVWLWRPEFFQPGDTSTQALPQTARNPLEGRTDIVVATDPAPDSNAAPLLAGLGIFGVVGFGWLFSRWRRVRTEF